MTINTNSFAEEGFPFLYSAVFTDFCYSPYRSLLLFWNW